jgi:hypothetical protein
MKQSDTLHQQVTLEGFVTILRKNSAIVQNTTNLSRYRTCKVSKRFKLFVPTVLRYSGCHVSGEVLCEGK